MKNILIFIGLIFSVNLHGSEPLENGDVEFIIVHGVQKVLSFEHGRYNNIAPWNYPKESDPDVVVISHGCHFYEIQYVSQTLSEHVEGKELGLNWLLIQPGEFCDLSGYVFAHPTLIASKYWGGRRYLIDSVPIRFGENDTYFITDQAFIAEYGFSRLYESLNYKDDIEACDYLDILRPVDADRLKKNNNVFISGEKLCYKKGVYLHRLIAQKSSNKSIQPTANASAD